MSNVLTPFEAAKLAQTVYAIRKSKTIAEKIAKTDFHKSAQFSQQKNTAVEMKASVGINTKDTFTYCALGSGKYANDAFIICRGTERWADVLTDLNCGVSIGATAEVVHQGFNKTFNSLLPQIKLFLTSNKLNITGTIHCIGHSLGGAVASLISDWLAKKTIHHTTLYTFGSPRVGTQNFAKTTTDHIGAGNIYRVYHYNDPVPMVPVFPFIHAGMFTDFWALL